MEFRGLDAATLAYAFGAVALALAALHLVRRRRETRVVAFVPLFVPDARDARRASFLARSLSWLSLLVLLLIAALVVVAMGDPRRSVGRREARAFALLVDVSRSMGTRESSRTRLELARRAAARTIRALHEGDRATIIAVSADPEARTPLTDDHAALLGALEGLAVEDVHDDFRRAAELANDVLRGSANAEVVVFGDAANVDPLALDGLDRRIRLHHQPIGRATNNVGIRAFSIRRYPRDPSQSEILVSIENTDRRARRYELRIAAAGRTIDVRALELPPAGTHDEVLRHVGGAGSTFEATIHPIDGVPDAQPRDDHAYATLPPRRAIRVLVVSEDNLFLDAALLLDEAVEPTTIPRSAYRAEVAADVVIFDGWLPDEAPRIPAFYIHPVPRAGAFAPFAQRGERVAPETTRVDRDDPLLAGIDIDGVNVARVPIFVPAPSDRVLAAAGTTPLLVRGERGGVPFVALGYDLRESDLPMRMAFPVLLVRSLESLAGTSGDIEETYRTDRVARIRVDGADRGRARMRIVDPRGRVSEAPVVDGFVVHRPREVGFFRVESSLGERVLAASLGPASEIPIAPGSLVRRGRSAARALVPRRPERVRPWPVLVLVALGLVALEWWTHHRRWTA